MKKDLLVELYSICNNYNIDTRILKNCMYMSDEEIKKIISWKDTNYFKEKISTYLNLYFMKLEAEIKDKIINIIDNADANYQAKYISLCACNPNILSSNKLYEILEILNNAVGMEQICYAYQILCCDTINDNIIELAKIVSNANGQSQARYSANIVFNEKTIYNEEITKIVKIISNTKEDYQAEYASKIMCDENVITSDLGLKIVQIISEIKNNTTIKYAANIARNKDLLDNKEVIYYLNYISNIENEYELQKVYESIVNETNVENKHTEGKFWELFKEDPSLALDSLETSEIKPNTKIKIKREK